jgi:hypothetical protein
MLQGKSAFVPRRLSWIMNRSRAYFHALRVSRSGMTDFIELIGTWPDCAGLFLDR